MDGGTCPRCGAPRAPAEFLGEVIEHAASGSPAARLLEAVRLAAPAERGAVMARFWREAPELAAALACYVGTCGTLRSAAPAR